MNSMSVPPDGNEAPSEPGPTTVYTPASEATPPSTCDTRPTHEEGGEAVPERAGRYEIRGAIAHGGMGAVFLGRDTELNRDLAVKVLLQRHQEEPVLVRRFLDEAQISGQLQHPGVVPVHELGRLPDRRPFFTMKLVQGQTLPPCCKRAATRPTICPAS
jgi:hypothetical protein